MYSVLLGEYLFYFGGKTVAAAVTTVDHRSCDI